MDIQVVLTQDDSKLGKAGDVVKVSSGYAQNFLFPHKKAVPATSSSINTAKSQKDASERQRIERLEQAKELAQKISKVSLTLEASAGESDKLFGAVTSQDIQQALLKQSIKLDKKDIQMEEPLKKLGSYQVTVKLHPEVHTKLKVWIVKKSS